MNLFPAATMKKTHLRKFNVIKKTPFADVLQIKEETESKDLDESNVRENKGKSNYLKNGSPLIHCRPMNNDEMNNHIQKCLEMNAEHKITPKNAFALQLIDWVDTALLKDFSIMACALDAGATIYSNRVDALHRQVTQLAVEIGHCQKQNSRDNNERVVGCLLTENRKVKKKNIISTPETIQRKLKGKDPRSKYIKLNGLPGTIMSLCNRDDTNLCLSLENNLPYWKNWDDYKPTEAERTAVIPEYKIICIGAMGRQSSKTMQSKLTDVTAVNKDQYIVNSGMYEQSQQSFEQSNDFEKALNSQDKMEVRDKEVEVIASAMRRLNGNEEGSGNGQVSRFQAMKLIFKKGSDYDYLNTKNVHLWAGPEFWKRPKGALRNKKEKRMPRKNKPTKVISFNDDETNGITKQTLHKKRLTLSRKTIKGWKRNNFTRPEDLQFEAEYFLEIFLISLRVASTEKSFNANTTNLEKNIDSVYGDEIPDHVNSYMQNNCLYGLTSSGCSDKKPQLNKDLYNADILLQQLGTRHDFNNGTWMTKVITVTKEDDPYSTSPIDKVSPVSFPKIVTKTPIKYSRKPISVDMHHLKQTMLEIIRKDMEKGVLDKRVAAVDSYSKSSFTNVLKILPSKLEGRTKEDISPAIALMALLSLTNENNFHLQNEDNDIIVKDKYNLNS